MSDPTRNQDKIEPGDTVRVVLIYYPDRDEHFEYFDGVVLYTPQATGDSWNVREINHGRDPAVAPLRYVQTFAEIILIKKAE